MEPMGTHSPINQYASGGLPGTPKVGKIMAGPKTYKRLLFYIPFGVQVRAPSKTRTSSPNYVLRDFVSQRAPGFPRGLRD